MKNTETQIRGGRRIQKTGYAPAFGAKSLFKILDKAGFEPEMHKANTNSYYIEVYMNGRIAAIRVSDHSKGFAFDFEKVEAGVLKSQYDDFEGEVRSSESYEAVKSALKTWIELN